MYKLSRLLLFAGLLAVLLAGNSGVLFAQCGKTIINPETGLLDCIGILSSGAGTGDVSGGAGLTTANRLLMVGSTATAAQSDVTLSSGVISRAGTLGLSATGANVITLSTNGSERARFDSSGRFLLGSSTNRSGLFQITGDSTTVGESGTIKLISGTTTTYQHYLGITSAGLGYWQNVNSGVNYALPIAFQPIGGNVLIGTTTDDGSSKLQVAGTATAYSATVYNPTAVTGSSSLVVRAGAGQSGALQAWQNNAGTAMSYISTVGEFRLQDNTTNYVGAMNRSGGTDNGNYGLYLSHTAESASIYAGSSKTIEVKKDKVGFFGATPVAKQTALTAANASALNTGDATSDTVIGNIRTRLGELESRLQSYGLLN